MSDIVDELITLRDLFRYAITRFTEAELSFGHGASTALDDAAFLLLESLSLPIDDINPWLDARLTRNERRMLIERIEMRVSTRLPTPYIVGTAYIQGIPFKIDRRVIVPRSFIGELLCSDYFAPESGISLIPDPYAISSVADICTGSGCLAVLAAKVFPAAEIDAVDVSAEALEVAAENVARHGEGRVHLFRGDLYEPLAGRRYDIIIANPPYVDAAEMAELPPEYRAEPSLALAGGEDGLDIVRRLIDGAADHLAEGGGLLCEVGTGRERLEEAYPDLPFLWLDTEESAGEVFWIYADDLGRTTAVDML